MTASARVAGVGHVLDISNTLRFSPKGGPSPDFAPAAPRRCGCWCVAGTSAPFPGYMRDSTYPAACAEWALT